MYDIIGDVHGNAAILKKLLKKLGYRKKGGVFSHAGKKAVFIGDFINRGPRVRETTTMIRSMVEAGNAHAILGNHELNAILYYLKDENGKRLPVKNNTGFTRTQNAFRHYPEEWKSHRRWMRTLPLFLELGPLRMVHACWIDENIDNLKSILTGTRLKKSFLRKIFTEPESPEGKSVWQTTKGLLFEVPPDLSIRNKRKASIRSFRMKWWEAPEGKTFNGISFESKMSLPEYTIPPEILPAITPYPDNAPPVFFGHYCRGNGPFLIKDNICCVDSCVTTTKILTAYSWQGEDKLNENNLIKINL